MGHTNFHSHDLTTPDRGWQNDAACADMNPAVFFPTDIIGVNKARRICDDCEVREPCLAYALDNRIDDGVWGGVSERGRQQIRKQRRRLGVT